MSTKTTFKRIALVAVAALGFGVLSVVPSQADVSGLKVTATNGTASVLNSDSSTAATLNFEWLALAGKEDSITVSVISPAAACDGATERTPKPNAATATSAMRLNVVFEDICFLSIVDPRTIRGSA